MFGLGGGTFFLSYFLFEVPSNLVLARVGARLWVARIMITWGVLAAAMALITGAQSLYAMRSNVWMATLRVAHASRRVVCGGCCGTGTC